MITDKDKAEIRESIIEECTSDEVDVWLSTAVYTEIENGVCVKYDNGNIDNFYYVKSLVHSSDIPSNKVEINK